MSSGILLLAFVAVLVVFVLETGFVHVLEFLRKNLEEHLVDAQFAAVLDLHAATLRLYGLAYSRKTASLGRHPTGDAVGAFGLQFEVEFVVDLLEGCVAVDKPVGAEFVCQYDFKDDGLKRNFTEHNFGLLDYWCHPKPSYAAVAAMTRLVGHAEPEGLVEGINSDKTRIYRFRRDDGTIVLAAWAVEGKETVDFKNPIPAAYDLFGNPIEPPIRDGVLHLTDRPIYLIVKQP